MARGYPYKLRDASRHPPALSPDGAADDAEIPWVLIERKAYVVADCTNATTAYSNSSCGNQIQVTFNAARPPRVSHICVYCRGHHTDDQEDMIPIAPEVIAPDGDLVLLRIVVSPEEKDITGDADLYIYRPAGTGGPSLTRLRRPPGDEYLSSYEVGLLCCRRTKRPDDDPEDDQFYMVASLCEDRWSMPGGRGRFILNLYNSILCTWTTTSVSVEDQQLQQYRQGRNFIHVNNKVIVIGGEGNTMGFVDLWRGILLCDLHQGEANPTLSYIPFPQPPRPDELFLADPCLWRDIAVVKDRIKFVHQQLRFRPRSDLSGQYIKDDWVSTMWTRPVAATTSQMLDHAWEKVCCIESNKMDSDSSLLFDLVPKVGDGEGRPLSPFKRIVAYRPTPCLDDDGDTVCFMVKINIGDENASWVIAVDMRENRLRGIVEFAVDRQSYGSFAWLQSSVSKYLKKATGNYI